LRQSSKPILTGKGSVLPCCDRLNKLFEDYERKKPKNIVDLNSFRDCYEKRTYFVKHGFACMPLIETTINLSLASKLNPQSSQLF